LANVDPFVIPIPNKVLFDQELRPYFEYLHRFLHDLWERTGAGDDLIADLEADTTSADGGNRTNRFLQDEVEDIKGKLTELRRDRYRDDICLLENQISDLKRQNRRLEQEVLALKEQQAKAPRRLEQLIYEVAEREAKRATRRAEQLIDELTERHDIGV